MRVYRVKPVTIGEVSPEVSVKAESAEEAAQIATGLALVRGAPMVGPLRAKVYFDTGNATSMIRLYEPAIRKPRRSGLPKS